MVASSAGGVALATTGGEGDFNCSCVTVGGFEGYRCYRKELYSRSSPSEFRRMSPPKTIKIAAHQNVLGPL